MAAIVVPQGLLLTASGTIAGQPWANVFGLRVPSAYLIDQSRVNGIASEFRSFYLAFQAGLSSQWSVDQFSIQDLRTSTAPSWDASTTGLAGGNASDLMPTQAAIVASHSTGFRGKSYRGRTYLCGYTEATNTSVGEVLSTTAAGIVSQFTALRTALAALPGGPVEHAVVSRKLLVATPVTTTTVDPYWDRQNRRKAR